MFADRRYSHLFQFGYGRTGYRKLHGGKIDVHAEGIDWQGCASRSFVGPLDSKGASFGSACTWFESSNAPKRPEGVGTNRSGAGEGLVVWGPPARCGRVHSRY